MKRIASIQGLANARIDVDGRAIEALPRESLAVALGVAGIVHLRDSPRAGTPRGAFCWMGVCQECVVWVDGKRTASCMAPVRDGMRVSLRERP